MAIGRTSCEEDTSYVSTVVWEFAWRHKVPHLAGAVMDIYEAAIMESSRKTYGTGQRAYCRFLTTLSAGIRFPFLKRDLGKTELNLAFYMAFLLLEPTINQASTILNYENHVKYWFRTEGCAEEDYATPFLRQIRQGIRNILPASADSRRPLLLPLLMGRRCFADPGSNESRLLKFATILGFIGMMRPHSIEGLKTTSFSLITDQGRIHSMPKKSNRLHN